MGTTMAGEEASQDEDPEVAEGPAAVAAVVVMAVGRDVRAIIDTGTRLGIGMVARNFMIE